jgi:hypothetical protein
VRQKLLRKNIIQSITSDAILLCEFYAGIVIQNYSFLGMIFIYLLKGNEINFARETQRTVRNFQPVRGFKRFCLISWLA